MREAIGFNEFVGNETQFDGHLAGRFANDIMFWIVVNVITLSLILGVIVDTFGKLRLSRKARVDDRATKCFICHLDSYKFLNVDGHFEQHIKQDHNMWNYLYFTIYLEKTTKAQRNHHELYLFQEFIEKKSSILPFPVMKAMAIEEDVDEAEEAMKSIQQTCFDLQEKTKEISFKLSMLEEKQHAVDNSVYERSSDAGDGVSEVPRQSIGPVPINATFAVKPTHVGAAKATVEKQSAPADGKAAAAEKSAFDPTPTAGSGSIGRSQSAPTMQFGRDDDESDLEC